MSRFDEMSIAERILYVQDLWDRIAEELDGVPASTPIGRIPGSRLQYLSKTEVESVDGRRQRRLKRRAKNKTIPGACGERRARSRG
jgi:hypothetical protein